MDLVLQAATFLVGASHLLAGKNKENKAYAAWVHDACNAYLVRLRYGKRRHKNALMRHQLRLIRADAAKLLVVEKKKLAPVTKYPVVVQEWEESESGWGTRPDGASLHCTEADRKAYLYDYQVAERKRNPSGRVPESYSRTSGDPFVIDVDAATYEKIKASKNGLILWQRDYSALKNK